MAKIGENFVNDMIDRGRRELGGVLYGESNVAQPMYPLRGPALQKESESPGMEDPNGSVLEDRLAQVGQNRDDPGKDDRGMDRE